MLTKRARLLLIALIWPATLVAGPGSLAPDAEHWAFRAVRRPEPPAVRDTAWPANAIDHFVLARLEAVGLSPSLRADRRTLLRRATIDLTGLPPTRDEVESFTHDPGSDALSRRVDDLLGRREYGERWGRHWLDVARYSDTKGYVDAGERHYPFAYTYRDYVIRALNEDRPFDRFVREQLAADRLVGENDRSSLAALGFLTVGSRYNFFPHEIIDDRIDVVGRGLLGLTLACARCHDHRYDPISTEDYYALHGVFESSREPPPHELPVIGGSGGAGVDGEDLRRTVEERGRALETRRRELHARIQHEMRAWARDYLVYIVQTMPEHRTRAQPPLRTERGLLREATAYGSGGVVRWRRFIETCGPDHPVFGFWNRAVLLDRDVFADGAQAILEAMVCKGAINPLLGAALGRDPPASMVEVAAVTGRLLEETETLWRDLPPSGAGVREFDDPARAELGAVLHGADAPASVTLYESADLYHLDEHTDVRGRYAEVERAFLAAEDSAPRAMVLVDRERPVEPRVLERGDAERPGRRVERRLPSLLAHLHPGPFEEGSGRLELADAVVDPRNPLTARVIVNRVWAWHFGEGLVSTPSDLGARSAPPSHPDLLDYLASWLVDHGWSLKKLHRLILASSTWRQRSDDRPEARRVDPANRLLWRMNRRRLDFESMRDSMLAVSGRLERGGGGPPVRSAPDDPAATHRTIYGLVDRERLPGVMRVFDFPSPDISCPERPRTTVPQQSLFLLNSPFMLAQADAVARRVERELPEDDRGARIRAIYRTVYAREPETAEVALAERFLDERYAMESPAETLSPAPWSELAQALLQSNEFLFVD